MSHSIAPVGNRGSGAHTSTSPPVTSKATAPGAAPAQPHAAQSKAAPPPDAADEAPAAPVRDDLRLYPSAPFADGAPAWVIQDPVSNRFYRIGWLEYECLLRWHQPATAIAQAITATTTLDVEAEQVQAFAQFLDQHNLLRATPKKVEQLKKKSGEVQWKSGKWWLHTYLFVRVPLVRPQRFLEKLMPWVAPIFTLSFLWALLGATALGLVLVARQWDTFVHSFMDTLSPEGLAGFVLALIVSKTLHEMGHALVATRFGVRVAHMGVAFVVLWPMLYTDTSESWRLRLHRQRLAISIAGISAEVGLAGLATLAWALLDDGLLRQAMLYLATTGWILSLALNVSPFMRFDGYFIASDLMNFPNLHERAGAIAKAWMRRKLLGWKEPDPEPFAPSVLWKLRVFAYITWLYRLTVFLGIAFAVYYFFFKALGIFLLMVELWWFVAKPVWTEMMVWKKRWAETPLRNRLLLWALGSSLIVLAAFPWSANITAPGVARAEHQQVLYSPQAAQLVALAPATDVAAGTTLAQLVIPDLLARQQRTQASVASLAQQLPQLMAREDGLDVQQATAFRLQEQLAESRALADEAAQLQLRAQFAGQWRDVDPLLHPGSWVDMRTPLGVLVDTSSWVVDAYLEQQQINHIAVGAQASFWPQNLATPLRATVVSIDSTRSKNLPYVMLDARYGGSVATQPHEQQVQPIHPMYRVRLQLHEPPPQLRELRGTTHIQAQRRSWLWRVMQGGLSVVIRESGF